MVSRAHILLSEYLAGKMQIDAVNRQKRSLDIGSILPDRIPKRRFENHEFTGTWEGTKELIRSTEAMTVETQHDESFACRQIGMVLHYLADYFTCPHNPSYGLNLLQHGIYENKQSVLLRTYLQSLEASARFQSRKIFAAQLRRTDDLFSHIEQMHRQYLQEHSHTPEGDCKWILDVCGTAAVVMMTEVYGESPASDCRADQPGMASFDG